MQVGRPIVKSFADEKAHRYELSVDQATFMRVAVEQRGVNVNVKVLSEDGRQLDSSDVMGTPGGTESLSLELEPNGRYEVWVSLSSDIAIGNYQLELEILRSPSDDDRSLLEAEQNYRAGLKSPSGGSKREGVEQNIEELGRAMATWSRLGDKKWLARAAARRGSLWLSLGEIDQAEADFELAISSGRPSGAKHAVATSTMGAAVALDLKGAWEEAADTYKRALEVFRQLEDPYGESEVLEAFGICLYDQGRFSEAEELQRQALGIRRRLGMDYKIGKSLSSLGLILEEQGDVDAALELHREALPLRQQANPVAAAIAKSNMARAYLSAGEHQEALRWWLEAAEDLRPSGRKSYRASVLGNIAATYRRLGEPQLALETYSQAEALAIETQNFSTHTTLLINRGKAFLELGDLESAEKVFEQVLAMAKERKAWLFHARALNRLAHLLLIRSRNGSKLEITQKAAEALELLRTAEKVFREKGVYSELGAALIGISESQIRLRDLEAADAGAQEALLIAQESGDRYLEVEALTMSAEIAALKESLDVALRLYERALEIVEAQRRAVWVPDLRSSFFSRHHDVYVESAALYARLHEMRPGKGFDRRSLAVADKAQARRLMDYLRPVAARPSSSRQSQSLVSFRKLQRSLSIREQQWRKRQRGGNASLLEEAKSATLDLRRQVHRLGARLAAEDPRFAAVEGWADVPVEILRRRFVGPESLFISFLVGEKQSLVYVVTDKTIEIRRLPPESRIEAESRRYGSLLSISRHGGIPQRARSATDRLGQLLMSPIGDLIHEDVKVLYIVADSALHNVAFAALSLNGRLLNERFAIVMLPSASSALLLSDQRRPESHTALIVGDAVYGSNDRDGSRTLAGSDLEQLPYTRIEAQSLERLWPGKTRILLAETATAANVLAENLGDFELLHFGAHSILDSQRPGAAGLVLTPSDRGDLISIRDIYDLELTSRLVTLSSCSSAKGRVMAGEGVRGLAGAFLYAGSQNVLAALWNVDDEATSELMAAFYEIWLQDGASLPEALRRAQQRLRQNPRYAAPYYWAPFVLLGAGG